jgi:hypothetical protein
MKIRKIAIINNVLELTADLAEDDIPETMSAELIAKIKAELGSHRQAMTTREFANFAEAGYGFRLPK